MTTKSAIRNVAKIEQDAEIPFEALIKLVQQRRKHIDMLAQLAATAAGLDEPEIEMGVGRDGAPFEPVTKRGVTRNVAAHPIELAYHRKKISFRQWAAGDRYRTDWYTAQISPARAVSFEHLANYKPVAANDWQEIAMPDGTTKRSPVLFPKSAPKPVKAAWHDIQPIVLDAQDRLKKVSRKLDRESFDLIERFCGEGWTIKEIASMRKHGARNLVGRKVQAALHELADYYGFPRPRQGGKILATNLTRGDVK